MHDWMLPIDAAMSVRFFGKHVSSDCVIIFRLKNGIANRVEMIAKVCA